MIHGEKALLILVLVALGGLTVGCACAWLKPSSHENSIYRHRRQTTEE